MATTTQRGYGWEHQKARAAALRHLAQQGEAPCPFCHQPMTVQMALDYDHYPPLALGPTPMRVRRLGHSTCNRRAGQQLSRARIRARSAPTAVNSRAW